MRQITKTDCNIRLEASPEFCEVRGSFASGDDAQDKAWEDGIIASLENGDMLAWCIMTVTVEFNGIEESDSIGGCSYDSLQDFKDHSGYYDDMVNECLSRLNKKAKGIVEFMTAEGIAV